AAFAPSRESDDGVLALAALRHEPRILDSHRCLLEADQLVCVSLQPSSERGELDGFFPQRAVGEEDRHAAEMLQLRPNCECCDRDLPPGSFLAPFRSRTDHAARHHRDNPFRTMTLSVPVANIAAMRRV